LVGRKPAPAGPGTPPSLRGGAPELVEQHLQRATQGMEARDEAAHADLRAEVDLEDGMALWRYAGQCKLRMSARRRWGGRNKLWILACAGN